MNFDELIDAVTENLREYLKMILNNGNNDITDEQINALLSHIGVKVFDPENYKKIMNKDIKKEES